MRLSDDIDCINPLVDEIEEDIGRTTERIEECVDPLDELALKVARASRRCASSSLSSAPSRQP